jgi:hypothetical protein
MASITTILGTDSVSSSRIVINNNFAALNSELGSIAALLNTATQTLSLTGEVKGGTLRVNNGTIDTFNVSLTAIVANVEATFNQAVQFNNALILKIEDAVSIIPTGGYTASTYILDATTPAFSAPILLPAAENGQEIVLIAEGGAITLNTSNFAGATGVIINAGGSVTLRYSETTSEFYVISAMNAAVEY